MPVDDVIKDLHFPKAGIDLSQSFSTQPNRPVGTTQYPQQQQSGSQNSLFAPNTPMYNTQYARSTPVGVNVRGYESATQRLRGGSRCGLSKYVPTQVVGSRFIVQDLNNIVIDQSGGTMAEPSQSGRVVSLVAVGQGNIYVTTPGAGVWNSPALSAGLANPPLNFSGLVLSAINQQKIWYADGVHYCFYDPTDGPNGTVGVWAPAAADLQGNLITSVLPKDSAGNTPRLIETWRGRTCLSGLLLDPQNWFFSGVNQPGNFDYNPVNTTPTQAVAGNNSPLGNVGDVVTSMCPYTDDVLVFFGNHTIWLMNGDPMAGGQIDLVSTAIGGTFGRCWCMDPYGNIYFMSNGTGIYVLVPGNAPQRISQPIEQLLFSLNTGESNVRLMWDDRFQGVHFFITPLVSPTPTAHLFFEQRTGAWWQDQFANPLFNPIACVVMDGNTAEDRVPLIGGWDGYVRAIDPLATTDDGYNINSEVLIGPLLTPTLDEMTLYELQAVLGETSGEVNYAIYIGSTAEEALESEPVEAGLWLPGRNVTDLVRESGHAIFVGLTSQNPWSMEAIRMRLGTRGKVRQRRAR